MIARFRRLYGDSQLHLVVGVACLLVAGAAVAGWFDAFPGPTAVKILEWFVVAIVAHDLVGVPLYSLLDRIAFGPFGEGRKGSPPQRVPGFVYVRIPALLSGLLLLVFFPEVFRIGDATFFAASGLHQRVFLARYLITCGALFGLSGFAYAVRLARTRLASEHRHDLAGVAQAERGAGGIQVDVVGEHRRGGHEREHEVGPEHERDRPDAAGPGERGERQNPEDVPGRGPAERDDDNEQRHGGGGEPVGRAAPGPESAGGERSEVDEREEGVEGGGLAAEPERQADQVRDPDRGDEPALGGEVGEVRAERDEAGEREEPGRDGCAREEPPPR